MAWEMSQPLSFMNPAAAGAVDSSLDRCGVKLVVMLPALDEGETIGSVLDRIPDQIPGVGIIESLVVNDASSDDTEAVAIAHGASVLSNSVRLGLGAVFQTGLERALQSGADIIVNIDADGQFDPADIPKLINPIFDGQAGLVTATRFAIPELIPTMPAVKLWGNRWVTRIVNLISGRRFTDASCGFRAYSRDAALQLTLFARFTYTHEVLIDAASKRIEIVEVPLKIRGERQQGSSRIAASVWRYGIQAGRILLLAARDYRPLHFFGIPGIVLVTIGGAAGCLNFGAAPSDHSIGFQSGTGLLAGVLSVVGGVMIVAAMLADMLRHTRIVLEKTAYLVRRDAYRNNAGR